MRPGLVVVGVAFIAVAAASAASLYVWPSDGSTRTITTDVPSTATGPHETREALLVGTNTSSGSFRITWASDQAFEVELYEASTCTSTGPDCHYGPLECEWTSNETGSWSSDGPLQFPYLLVWTTHLPTVGSLEATAVSVAEVASPEPVWATLATAGALASLGAVGLVAFFLGAFLRGQAYRRPPAPGPGAGNRGPRGPTDPRTGSPDDVGASPPRGPRAPGR